MHWAGRTAKCYKSAQIVSNIVQHVGGNNVIMFTKQGGKIFWHLWSWLTIVPGGYNKKSYNIIMDLVKFEMAATFNSTTDN